MEGFLNITIIAGNQIFVIITKAIIALKVFSKIIIMVYIVKMNKAVSKLDSMQGLKS